MTTKKPEANISARPERLKARLFGSIGILLCCLGGVLLVHRLSLPVGADSDFSAFYYAKQPYPPLIYLLFIPFTWLSLQSAYLLWSFFSIAVYLLLLLCVIRTLKLQMAFHGLVLLVGILLTWFPFHVHISLGQVSIFLTFCMVSGWVFLRRGQEVWCGLLWGLACALKLFPGLLLFYLLLRKRWRGALAMSVATIAGVLVPLIALPEIPITYFLDAISKNSSYYIPYPINVSLHGVVSRLFLDNHWLQPIVSSPALVLVLRVGLSLAMGVWLGWQLLRLPSNVRDDGFAFAYTCIAMILLSPISWTHIFPLLFLPLGLLLRAFLDSPVMSLRREILLVWVCFSLPDIPYTHMITQLYAPDGPPWWAGLPLLLPSFGLLYLLFLLAKVRGQINHESVAVEMRAKPLV